MGVAKIKNNALLVSMDGPLAEIKITAPPGHKR